MYNIFYYSVNFPKCQPPSCRQLDPYHESLAALAYSVRFAYSAFARWHFLFIMVAATFYLKLGRAELAPT